MEEPKIIEGTATRRAPRTPPWMWAYLLAGAGFFLYLALASFGWNWTMAFGFGIPFLLLGIFLGATVWHRNDGVFKDPNER